MQIGIVSLFPEMFAALNYGIPGRAIEAGLVKLSYWNPRDYTADKHRRIDDRPYGGGPGMVLQAEPLQKALQQAKLALPKAKTVYLSPQGQVLTQASVKEFAALDDLILISGRYEGIDERFIEANIDEEWSVGDYVLSGGELAAMVLCDAVIRLIPGSLGDCESAEQDSFSQGLLDHPHYTRPELFAGRSIPEVLKSGDHAAIRRWRLKQSLGRTWVKRPELLDSYPFDAEQQALLTEFIEEYRG